MGMLISRTWNKLFFSNREYKIIIVGLAGAGKTTMLYQLYTTTSWNFTYNLSQLGKAVQTKPTIGSNMEEVKNKNVKLQVCW